MERKRSVCGVSRLAVKVEHYRTFSRSNLEKSKEWKRSSDGACQQQQQLGQTEIEQWQLEQQQLQQQLCCPLCTLEKRSFFSVLVP